MVVGAEECAVAEVGGAVVGPVGDVVGFAPGCGGGAVGEGAALVAGGEGGALGWGEEPGFAAEVQDFAVGAEEGGDDVGVAGDFAQGGGGDGAGEDEGPGPGASGAGAWLFSVVPVSGWGKRSW